MNCVPATCEQLGADVVAKKLFSHSQYIVPVNKIYPQPSYVDKVVGICLYNCNFHSPGLKEQNIGMHCNWK